MWGRFGVWNMVVGLIRLFEFCLWYVVKVNFLVFLDRGS